MAIELARLLASAAILLAAMSCSHERPRAEEGSSIATREKPPQRTQTGGAMMPGKQPQLPPRARAADELPTCPGINPDIRRPKGSNCLGIVPSQCGADTARRFLGQRYDEALHTRIEQAVGHARIRAVREGDAVTDDLRPDRLNVFYNRSGKITKVDCY